MTSYYDLILALIPVSMIGLSAALLAVGFSLTTAVPIAASLAVGLIGHAMFVRAPVPSSPAQATAGVADVTAD